LENKRISTTADRLKEALQACGKKPSDLANATGINKGSISRYLSGAFEPKQKAIGKLARALGVSEMWLCGYEVEKERSEAQKKNDDLVVVVAKLRNDPEFFDVVQRLAQLPQEEYASVKQIISALGNK